MAFFKYFLTFLCLVGINGYYLNRCGLADRLSGLIVNGTKTPRGKYPWLAALIHNEFNQFFCAATLISNKHLLTAAHCMQQKLNSKVLTANEFVVFLGKHEISNNNESGTLAMRPMKVVIHPSWNYETENYDADISVIFLKQNLRFSSHIFPVCLWISKEFMHVDGVVVGWGQSEKEALWMSSNTPHEVNLSIVSNEKCFLEHHLLTFLSSARTFCAKGQIGSGPCLGDSGGGFFIKSGRNWFLRGIVSSSLLNKDGSCDVTRHSIYTNIFSFTDWIVGVTEIKIEVVSSVDIITRSMWGAAPPGPSLIALTPPSTRVMISHTVTYGCNDRQECIEMMQSLQTNAQNIGYNDIYCNFFIGGDGLIFEGRGWAVRGEHTVSSTQSHNDAVCVSFIGNYQQRPPKQSQIDALFKLLQSGVDTGMLVPNYVINAQRDFHPSQSPGDAFYKIVKTWPRFKKRVET